MAEILSPQETSRKDIRTIYFVKEWQHQEYDEQGLYAFIQTWPQSQRDFLSNWGSIHIECIDGTCICSLNRENGDVLISGLILKPQDTTIDYSDTPYPGEEKLATFLQKKCTESFRIWTNVTVRFSDTVISFTVGIQLSTWVHLITEKVWAQIEAVVS